MVFFKGRGRRLEGKVLFIIKHKNKAMALVFLVESIIGCFHILKGWETYTSELFQPQKAARGCERSGPKWGLLGPDPELQNTEPNSQFNSAPFNSHSIIRGDVAMGIGSF